MNKTKTNHNHQRRETVAQTKEDSRPVPQVPVPQQQQMPAYLKDRAKQDAGKGVSTEASESLVPLIYILDAKSPQCDDRSQTYIQGAKAGSIWLRNFTPPIVDGQDGILFQPCAKWTDWVEWIPRERGGGFVARHPQDPSTMNDSDDTARGRPKAAKATPHPENPNKMRWVLPNGNEVRQTRNVAGYVLLPSGAFPFVIPFASTGHSVVKSWNFTMMSKRTPDGDILPSFACSYRLKTRQRSNAQGKWFVFDVADAGYLDEKQYEMGHLLNAAFEKGEKKAEAEVVATEAEDAM